MSNNSTHKQHSQASHTEHSKQHRIHIGHITLPQTQPQSNTQQAHDMMYEQEMIKQEELKLPSLSPSSAAGDVDAPCPLFFLDACRADASVCSHPHLSYSAAFSRSTSCQPKHWTQLTAHSRFFSPVFYTPENRQEEAVAALPLPGHDQIHAMLIGKDSIILRTIKKETGVTSCDLAIDHLLSDQQVTAKSQQPQWSNMLIRGDAAAVSVAVKTVCWIMDEYKDSGWEDEVRCRDVTEQIDTIKQQQAPVYATPTTPQRSHHQSGNDTSPTSSTSNSGSDSGSGSCSRSNRTSSCNDAGTSSVPYREDKDRDSPSVSNSESSTHVSDHSWMRRPPPSSAPTIVSPVFTCNAEPFVERCKNLCISPATHVSMETCSAFCHLSCREWFSKYYRTRSFNGYEDMPFKEIPRVSATPVIPLIAPVSHPKPGDYLLVFPALNWKSLLLGTVGPGQRVSVGVYERLVRKLSEFHLDNPWMEYWDTTALVTNHPHHLSLVGYAILKAIGKQAQIDVLLECLFWLFDYHCFCNIHQGAHTNKEHVPADYICRKLDEHIRLFKQQLQRAELQAGHFLSIHQYAALCAKKFQPCWEYMTHHRCLHRGTCPYTHLTYRETLRECLSWSNIFDNMPGNAVRLTEDQREGHQNDQFFLPIFSCSVMDPDVWTVMVPFPASYHHVLAFLSPVTLASIAGLIGLPRAREVVLVRGTKINAAAGPFHLRDHVQHGIWSRVIVEGFSKAQLLVVVESMCELMENRYERVLIRNRPFACQLMSEHIERWRKQQDALPQTWQEVVGRAYPRDRVRMSATSGGSSVDVDADRSALKKEMQQQDVDAEQQRDAANNTRKRVRDSPDIHDLYSEQKTYDSHIERHSRDSAPSRLHRSQNSQYSQSSSSKATVSVAEFLRLPGCEIPCLSLFRSRRFPCDNPALCRHTHNPKLMTPATSEMIKWGQHNELQHLEPNQIPAYSTHYTPFFRQGTTKSPPLICIPIPNETRFKDEWFAREQLVEWETQYHVTIMIPEHDKVRDLDRKRSRDEHGHRPNRMHEDAAADAVWLNVLVVGREGADNEDLVLLVGRMSLRIESVAAFLQDDRLHRGKPSC